jgi:hypothetical protein
MPKNGKRGKKNGNGRGGGTVTSLSKSQMWDAQLARTKDACHLSDRLIFVTLTSGAGLLSTSIPITVTGYSSGSYVQGTLGSRVFNIGQNYARWRVNRLLACYRPVVGTTTPGVLAVGFVDDPNTSLVPTTTYTTVDEARCSHADSVYREIEVEWRPIDRSIWFYTAADPLTSQSLADYRFESPCSLNIASAFTAASTTFGICQLYYDISFEGAQNANQTA